ncbi:MAG: hypothetical protein ACLFUK_05060 [Halanaerobium sp.]
MENFKLPFDFSLAEELDNAEGIEQPVLYQNTTGVINRKLIAYVGTFYNF